jgi:hypothetical protein
MANTETVADLVTILLTCCRTLAVELIVIHLTKYVSRFMGPVVIEFSNNEGRVAVRGGSSRTHNGVTDF